MIDKNNDNVNSFYIDYKYFYIHSRGFTKLKYLSLNNTHKD